MDGFKILTFVALEFKQCHLVSCNTLLCSQVKADRHSKKLTKLQQASRQVNEMAANVVASTKTGQEHLEDKGGWSLTCATDHHKL